MKLTMLLEQCESDNTAASLLAKRRFRYHATEVLPGVLHRLKVISESKGVLKASDIRKIAAEGLRIAEEVQDHSEQLTPDQKPQTVKMP